MNRKTYKEKGEFKMKKLILLVAALVLVGSNAWAYSWQTRNIGDTDYYTSSNGDSYQGRYIGGTYYVNDMQTGNN